MAQVELNPCSLEALQQTAPCFDCLTKSEKYAAIDWLLAKAYLQLSGSADDLTTMRQSAMCMACEPEPVLDSFLLVLAMRYAYYVGAIDGAMTAEEVRDAVRCWQCGIGGKELKAIAVLALCGVIAETPRN